MIYQHTLWRSFSTEVFATYQEIAVELTLGWDRERVGCYQVCIGHR